MTNPWIRLPNKAPFILLEDQEVIEAFNKKRSGKKTEIMLDQLPSPYVGDPKAPVVILNLNPAYAKESARESSFSLYEKIARANFEHIFSDYPFYPLNPDLKDVSAAGHDWWSKACLGDLIPESRLNFEKFSEKIFCVEFLPYHSERNGWKGSVLPSQKYAIALVEAAVDRGALIIIMWGNRNKRTWFEAVPTLASANVITLRNPQCKKISKGNLNEGAFEKIIKHLQI